MVSLIVMLSPADILPGSPMHFEVIGSDLGMVWPIALTTAMQNLNGISNLLYLTLKSMTAMNYTMNYILDCQGVCGQVNTCSSVMGPC